jgi:superfamily II DNA or RNA helicase
MLERFDQQFEILTGPRAREEFSAAERFGAPLKAIGSLHMLRSDPILQALATGDLRFDLVIVDESHHMQNPETISHRLGEQLSAAADHMLMLSATPLSLSTANLFHQLSILVPEEFFDVSEFDATIAPNQHLNQAIRALRNRPPSAADALEQLRRILALGHGTRFRDNPAFAELCRALAALNGEIGPELSLELQARINELNTIGHVFTRTRKREVQDHFPARRAHVIRVDLSPEERQFYDAVTAFVRSGAGDQFSSFATIMPQRQVASSIPAAREYLRERWLGSVVVEEDTAAEAELTDEENGELSQLPVNERLRKAWSGCTGIDSKYEKFVAALEQMIVEGTAADGKVLVFSFFRKTIEHLAARLRDLEVAGQRLRVSILYGPTAEEDRHRIVRAFREEPGPHVVLSSEVAAEGLDFEFANAMVNYDLPWNPMRVEQRIGRLDRYGQSANVIHIFNFSVADTIEERILERLYERIGIFQSAIGDLESILGHEIEWLTRELLQPDLTAEEEEEVISQAAENILRRKSELERFERDSQNLLGQDDIFTEQLHRLEREQRFVGPEETRNFVTVGLRKRHPKIRLLDRDGTTFVRIPSDEDGVRELMSNYLQGREDRNGRAWRSVGRAGAGSNWAVTFDPEVAKRNRDLDFVTLHHPLVGALLEEEPAQLRPTVALTAVDAERPGRFAFLLFLLRIHSFKPALEFLPVAVELGADVDESVSSRLLALLPSATSWEQREPYATDGEIDAAVSTATSWMSRRIDERRTDLQRVSDQILDRRIESLGTSHERWLGHRQRLLTDAIATGQQSIVRLHQGYMRRREGEVAAKLAELERQKGVEIGYELVAGGLLHLASTGVNAATP